MSSLPAANALRYLPRNVMTCGEIFKPRFLRLVNSGVQTAVTLSAQKVDQYSCPKCKRQGYIRVETTFSATAYKQLSSKQSAHIYRCAQTTVLVLVVQKS